MTATTAKTAIATSTPTDVVVRGKSLCDELIGRIGFTDMLYLVIVGRVPDAGQRAVVDACLVALVEHGLTPSAIATRLVYGSAPEAMQGAVAAGLLGVGGRFVGTAEGCGVLLARIAGAADPRAEADAVVAEHVASRTPVPGFGHDTHVPDDPRSPAILGVARSHGVAGRHVAALEHLSAALDAAKRRHVTINATGAFAAALADAGVPIAIVRGFALIARCAGLVAHVREEQRDATMPVLWQAADRALPYDPGERP
jgi:citrate synthase